MWLAFFVLLFVSLEESKIVQWECLRFIGAPTLFGHLQARERVVTSQQNPRKRLQVCCALFQPNLGLLKVWSNEASKCWPLQHSEKCMKCQLWSALSADIAQLHVQEGTRWLVQKTSVNSAHFTGGCSALLMWTIHWPFVTSVPLFGAWNQVHSLEKIDKCHKTLMNISDQDAGDQWVTSNLRMPLQMSSHFAHQSAKNDHVNCWHHTLCLDCPNLTTDDSGMPQHLPCQCWCQCHGTQVAFVLEIAVWLPLFKMNFGWTRHSTWVAHSFCDLLQTINQRLKVFGTPLSLTLISKSLMSSGLMLPKPWRSTPAMSSLTSVATSTAVSLLSSPQFLHALIPMKRMISESLIRLHFMPITVRQPPLNMRCVHPVWRQWSSIAFCVWLDNPWASNLTEFRFFHSHTDASKFHSQLIKFCFCGHLGIICCQQNSVTKTISTRGWPSHSHMWTKNVPTTFANHTRACCTHCAPIWLVVLIHQFHSFWY